LSRFKALGAMGNGNGIITKRDVEPPNVRDDVDKMSFAIQGPLHRVANATPLTATLYCKHPLTSPHYNLSFPFNILLTAVISHPRHLPPTPKLIQASSFHRPHHFHCLPWRRPIRHQCSFHTTSWIFLASTMVNDSDSDDVLVNTLNSTPFTSPVFLMTFCSYRF
jgi:hypothetical protein